MMKPRKLDENTFVYDIPMEGVPMDAIDVTQGGECVYGMNYREHVRVIFKVLNPPK